MFRPFADPLLAAAECRLSPSRPSAFTLLGSPCVSRFHSNAAVKQTAFLARDRTHSHPAAKRRPNSMSCREAAAPWLIRYGVAHLLSCAATSMIDRGRRLTDEAFRTRVGKPSAGSSGWLLHVFAPVWHSGALLRASNRRGRASRVDSCRDPNRSRATIQAIFCVPELCKTHNRSLARSARGVPVRSGYGLSTASPAAEKSAATAFTCPAPISTTNRPSAPSSRPASVVISR
jgi:hypothetical protein